MLIFSGSTFQSRYIIYVCIPIFQVSWVRYRDTSLIAVGKFVYISDHRFKVLHEPNSSEWFLIIKAVTYEDEGIYECQVNSEPYKTYQFQLSVVGEYFLAMFILQCDK